VELTPEGEVFLADAKQLLDASDRATRKVQAVARGEAGTLRLAYTHLAAHETTPALLELLSARCPELKVTAREEYGAEIPNLLLGGGCDLALIPMSTYPAGLRQRLVRREAMRLAVSTNHPLAGSEQVELSAIADERIQVWPRDMAPGFYDVVVGACRGAGFEPTLDEHRAGGAVMCSYIARGHGVGLVVSSMEHQMPPGIAMVQLAPPRPVLAINAIWPRDGEAPSVASFLDAAASLAAERGWR
jgi:DNA-binding transcriptional LysR family regulator